MVDGEIVGTAHMAIQAAVLHEADEMFRYNGRTIFNPHRDIQALFDISVKENVDVRQAPIEFEDGAKEKVIKGIIA